MEKIIALLIAGYFIADLSLQAVWMSKCKRNFLFHVLLGLIHAGTAYIAFQSWAYWELPLAVFLIHLLINAVKGKDRKTALACAVEQSVYLTGITAVVVGLKIFAGMPDFAGMGFTLIVTVGGFVATVQWAGLFVAKFTKRLIDENNLKLDIDGLKDGGKWIGRLERALIFAFIFCDYPAGIGFLVAAKSILRFENARQQKVAEYVLIGTLMSFALAIALALLTKWVTTFPTP